MLHKQCSSIELLKGSQFYIYPAGEHQYAWLCILITTSFHLRLSLEYKQLLNFHLSRSPYEELSEQYKTVLLSIVVSQWEIKYQYFLLSARALAVLCYMTVNFLLFCQFWCMRSQQKAVFLCGSSIFSLAAAEINHPWMVNWDVIRYFICLAILLCVCCESMKSLTDRTHTVQLMLSDSFLINLCSHSRGAYLCGDFFFLILKSEKNSLLNSLVLLKVS